MLMKTRFRPLAGIMVLIACSMTSKEKELLKCFRPLAGIMVLIDAFFDDDFNEILFPSPCGDYGSYRRRLEI